MREASRPFLTAQWRHLIVLSYAVDPASLSDRVPAGTTLDAWRGTTFVSLVGFRFQNTQVLGVPVPFHREFEEVNLRFYVQRETNEGTRRGVVFIREVVPRRVVSAMARLVYREPYVVAPMRSTVNPGPPPSVEYHWDAGGRRCTIAAIGKGEGSQPTPGALEEFLTVRHWGYNGEPGEATLEYRVEHPRWRIWPAPTTRVDYEATQLCDPKLARELTTPVSALIADGSAVTVHWRHQITGASGGTPAILRSALC